MQTETKVKVENVMINEELENWMPPLSKEETDNLVDSLIDHGFDASYGKILVWNPMEEPDRYYIVDGHNRFKICQELNIELSDECFSVVDCQNEDAVKKLMLDIQLSRRNLSVIKRIEAAERCRPIYEKEAKEAQTKAGGDRKSEEYQKSVTPKLVEVISDRTDKETNAKLAKKAGIGKETYRKGVVILNSDNETVKQQVMSGKSLSVLDIGNL